MGAYRIADATTAFGINLSVGTHVYNVDTDKLYLTTQPVASTSTLTSASGSFISLAEDDHTHDLGRYSLKAPSNVDGLLANNFRTTMFGSSTAPAYQFSVGFWQTKPLIFSDLHDYGSMIAWGGGASNGFIAVDNAYDEAMIGGGTGNGLSWKEYIIHTGNIGDYGVTSESDPVYSGDPASGITSGNITNWNTAYGWGDHGEAGYLTSESDPVYSGDPASGITTTNINNWNSAYNWGDHANAGYLTSETDPDYNSDPASGITSSNITNWNTAHSWGNHANAGYLTSESDPIFDAHVASGITSTNISNWNTAYGWGDHSTEGYTTISNASSNRLVTSNGGTVLNGEANLSFDGSDLDVIGEVYTWQSSGGDYSIFGQGSDGGYLVGSDNDVKSLLLKGTSGGGSSISIYGDNHTEFGKDIVFATSWDDGARTALAIDGATGYVELHSVAHASSNGNILVRDGNIIKYRTPAEIASAVSETDPVYSGDPASGITSANITNWNTAYNWGDHSTEGYITDGNSGWDNSYGFITDGNTGWNNSYGFITASSTETLTNKSGSNSMWTNDASYITGNETITLSGDVSGSGSTSISVTVSDDSHNHTEIDLGTVSSDHTAKGQIVAMKNASGVTVGFGDVCYVGSDGFLHLADADASSTMPALYMAVESISNGSIGDFLRTGIVQDNTWSWTVGGLIYVSTTGSSTHTLTQTAPSGSGDQVQVVGVALHADKMDFNPNLTIIEIK